MSTQVRCSNCGATAAPGARFCMTCGRDLSGQQQPVATATSQPGTGTGQGPLQGPPPRLIERLRDATLGDYEILAELGRGGMATVFLAHDIQLDRKVAIKLMHPQTVPGDGLVERFKLEARTAAGLSHANIIPIYAVKHVGDLVYFVMKFVAGRPLDSIMKESGTLPVPMVRTILTKVAEALAYAHRNGVVHRDIKPANIMIDTEGLPIVTDFGIAKVSESQGLTMTGATIGTPTYMSPEQCNAQTITGASDQYSLGVMAYEMLLGRPPYEGDSVVNLMFKHVHGDVPTVEDFGPDVPRDLAEAVVRMLQKAPEDRWPSMTDAIPTLRGTLSTQEDTIRTQMIEFAMAGTNRSILARVSTPRSPLPSTTRKRLPSTEPTQRMTPPAESPSRLWLVAAVVLVVVAGAALAVWRPWQSRATEAPVAAAPAVEDTTPSVSTPEVTTSVGTDSSTPAAAAESTPPPATATERPSPPPAEPVAREVRIVDPPTTLAEGQSVALSAMVLDRQGRRMVDRSVRWSSSAPDVAAVEPDGQLRGVAAGTATLTAQAGALSAQMRITVTAVVASVAVAPSSGELRPGQTVTLRATALGRNGQQLAGSAIAWRSSDEAVAVVSNTGRVTAVGSGTATISATSEGQVGSARVTVSAPPAPPPDTVAPPPADPRPAIADLVRAYAHALETRDMVQVKKLYPSISPTVERRTRDALQAMDDLQVRLTPSQISVDGTSARAEVTGEWTYHGGQRESRNVYVFERRAAGWVIVAIN